MNCFILSNTRFFFLKKKNYFLNQGLGYVYCMKEWLIFFTTATVRSCITQLSKHSKLLLSYAWTDLMGLSYIPLVYIMKKGESFFSTKRYNPDPLNHQMLLSFQTWFKCKGWWCSYIPAFSTMIAFLAYLILQ